jgi:hypothetical protein
MIVTGGSLMPSGMYNHPAHFVPKLMKFESILFKLLPPVKFNELDVKLWGQI